jgi:hypothetical protein
MNTKTVMDLRHLPLAGLPAHYFIFPFVKRPSLPMPSAIGCRTPALTINITSESYRGVKARKLASKKKDA